MKKAIIFDLSDVYIKGILGVEDKISKLIGNKVNNEDLYNETSTELFRGKISEDEYWKLIISRNKWNISPIVLKKIMRKHMEEIEGARELIEELRKNNNHKLGLLSVHAKEWVAYCEKKFRYHNLFDCTIYSYEIGICKPEKKAFEAILSILNVSLDESYFIDDSLDCIIVAKKLGMKTIHFKNAKQLRYELAMNGFAVKI